MRLDALFRGAGALAAAAILGVAQSAAAENAVKAVKLERESPTLHCLGYRWYVTGDENRNAAAAVSFRKADDKDWRKAMPLRRVEVEALEDRRPPDGQGLFAGSIMFLEPDTEYEVRLELSDPDGGSAKEDLKERTWKEPVAPQPKRVLHVAPGTGGGSGAEQSPFQGFAAAISAARPGDLVLVHKGTYPPITIAKSGAEGAPIVLRAAGDGEAAIEGGGVNKGIGIAIYGQSHVFFEGLTVRKVRYAFHLNGSRDLVVRRMKLTEVGTGVFGDGVEQRILVVDNVIEGPEPWPKPEGYKTSEEYRGVELSGTGHVVAYNRVRNFRDGIDVRTSWPIRGIDIHNNEISEMTDDGIELDYSEHNTRAFLNRITNTYLGISFQPICGGPAYAVRNVLMNVEHESFKLHLTPVNPKETWETGPHRTSGGVILQNTVVKRNPPFRVWSDEGPACNFLMRNNLLVGAAAGAIDISCPMRDCDLDCDAYVAGGEAFKLFAYWNKARYGTIADFAEKTGLEKHGLALPSPAGLFAAAVKIPADKEKCEPLDARLAPASAAVDKGEVLPGMNDGFAGKAPDIGAVEQGSELPQYGPRPENNGPASGAQRRGAGPAM